MCRLRLQNRGNLLGFRISYTCNHKPLYAHLAPTLLCPHSRVAQRPILFCARYPFRTPPVAVPLVPRSHPHTSLRSFRIAPLVAYRPFAVQFRTVPTPARRIYPLHTRCTPRVLGRLHPSQDGFQRPAAAPGSTTRSTTRSTFRPSFDPIRSMHAEFPNPQGYPPSPYRDSICRFRVGTLHRCKGRGTLPEANQIHIHGPLTFTPRTISTFTGHD